MRYAQGTVKLANKVIESKRSQQEWNALALLIAGLKNECVYRVQQSLPSRVENCCWPSAWCLPLDSSSSALRYFKPRATLYIYSLPTLFQSSRNYIFLTILSSTILNFFSKNHRSWKVSQLFILNFSFLSSHLFHAFVFESYHLSHANSFFFMPMTLCYFSKFL